MNVFKEVLIVFLGTSAKQTHETIIVTYTFNKNVEISNQYGHTSTH